MSKLKVSEENLKLWNQVFTDIRIRKQNLLDKMSLLNRLVSKNGLIKHQFVRLNSLRQ